MGRARESGDDSQAPVAGQLFLLKLTGAQAPLIIQEDRGEFPGGDVQLHPVAEI